MAVKSQQVWLELSILELCQATGKCKHDSFMW